MHVAFGPCLRPISFSQFDGVRAIAHWSLSLIGVTIRGY
jgi:hypothetical protein